MTGTLNSKEDMKRAIEVLFDDKDAETLITQLERSGIERKLKFYMADWRSIQTLLRKGLMDPDDQQNDSPTNKEFFSFMEEHEIVKAFGYIIPHHRRDSRVSIEGLEYYGTAARWFRGVFAAEFYDADELTISENRLRCWYD